MVMIDVGDAKKAHEMFDKADDAMTHVVHDMTEYEEALYESILAQLQVHILNGEN